MNLPESFCWTRFGTEAGETIAQILERKERERRSNGGVFLWGIGNSVGSAIQELVRRTDRPEVLFSPIKSKPRVIDVAPSRVVLWTMAEDQAGGRFSIPASMSVRGRATTEGRLAAHYALVCSSDQPLEVGGEGAVAFSALRNLVSGRRLGASQVTAVVRVDSDATLRTGEYVVALRARLVAPYFIRLREPITVEQLELDDEQSRPGSLIGAA